MITLRSILVALAISNTWLCAGPTDRGWRTARLQLALPAAEAKARADSKLQLAAVQELDFEARVARMESPAGKPFRPHTSLVEQSPVAVNARELLKRERSRMHGSVSLGIDSQGGWGTRLELHKQLLPDLLLEMGFSVRREHEWGWNHDSGVGWEASMALHKQLLPDFSLEIGFTVARTNGLDHDWN